MDCNDAAEENVPSLTLSRKIFSEQSFRKQYGYKSLGEIPIKERILNAVRPKEKDPARLVKNFLFGVIPILHWSPRYKVKKWLLADIISGLTIGIMQIPQGEKQSCKFWFLKRITRTYGSNFD